MNAEYSRLLLAHLDATIGRDASKWVPVPVGYPDEVEAALLDSVFSLRAVYGQSAKTGPRAVVTRWREHVCRPLDSLASLEHDVRKLGGPNGFRRVLRNDAVAVPNATDKPTKALAVYASTLGLLEIGISSAKDVATARSQRPKELWQAIQRGRGVGPQAATYFLMNLGIPGVKADVMINRFVQAAVGRKLSDVDAANLVTALAEELKVDVIHLDHVIWKHGSDASRQGKGTNQWLRT